MALRDATPADAEKIAAVARASWHGAYDELLGAQTVDATVDRWYDPDSLRQSIGDAAGAESAPPGERSVFLVAEREGAVVGFANAGPAHKREGGPEGADAFLADSTSIRTTGAVASEPRSRAGSHAGCGRPATSASGWRCSLITNAAARSTSRSDSSRWEASGSSSAALT